MQLVKQLVYLLWDDWEHNCLEKYNRKLLWSQQSNGKLSLLWMDQGVGSTSAFLFFFVRYVSGHRRLFDLQIKDNPNSIISIAFGAPHVCDEKVAKEVNKKSNFKARFINVVNEADPSRAFSTTSEALWQQDWGHKVRSCLIALMRSRGKMSSIIWPPTTQKRLIPPSFTQSASTHFSVRGLQPRVCYLQVETSLGRGSNNWSSRMVTWSTTRQQATIRYWSMLIWSTTQASPNLPSHAHSLPLFDQSQN